MDSGLPGLDQDHFHSDPSQSIIHPSSIRYKIALLLEASLNKPRQVTRLHHDRCLPDLFKFTIRQLSIQYTDSVVNNPQEYYKISQNAIGYEFRFVFYNSF